MSHWQGLTIAGFDGADTYFPADAKGKQLPTQLALRRVCFGDTVVYAASTIHIGNAGELAYWVAQSSVYGFNGLVLEKVATANMRRGVFPLPEAHGALDQRCPGEYWLLDRLSEPPYSGVFHLYSRHEDLSANQAMQLLQQDSRSPYVLADRMLYRNFYPARLVGRVYTGKTVIPPQRDGHFTLEPPTGSLTNNEPIVAIQHRPLDRFEVSSRWYGSREPLCEQIMEILNPSRGSYVTILRLIDSTETTMRKRPRTRRMKIGEYRRFMPDVYKPGASLFVSPKTYTANTNILKRNALHLYEQIASLDGFIGQVEAFLTWGW